MLATAPPRQHAGEISRTYTSDMAKRRIVSIRDARAGLKERVDAAQERGEHSILLRRSDVAAIIVPPEWYKAASELMGEPWDDWEPPAGAASDGTDS